MENERDVEVMMVLEDLRVVVVIIDYVVDQNGYFIISDKVEPLNVVQVSDV